MKVYALVCNNDDINDHLIAFELDVARARTLIGLCKEHDLNEAVIPLRNWKAYPAASFATAPTDGFISKEARERVWADEYFDFTPSAEIEIDADMIGLEALHIGQNGQIHAELVPFDGHTIWGEGLDIEEIAP